MSADDKPCVSHPPGVTVGVPAKVNVALHVVGQRDDGYHLLDSLVMFTEAPYDSVTVRFAPVSKRPDARDPARTDAAPHLSVDGPFAADCPPSEDNAVLRAARAVGGIAGVALHKGLPIASGLGGGAADAAAVLRAAVTAGRLTDGDAAALARTLGADVPVCLYGRACRMRGIGEEIAPLAAASVPVVLVNPRVPVATPAVFAALERKRNPPLSPAPRLDPREALIRTLRESRNDLAPPARAIAPVIGDAMDALSAQSGVEVVRMSGSGATVFAIFDSVLAAEAAARALSARNGWWVSATALAAA